MSKPGKTPLDEVFKNTGKIYSAREVPRREGFVSGWLKEPPIVIWAMKPSGEEKSTAIVSYVYGEWSTMMFPVMEENEGSL